MRASTGSPVQETNCHPFRHGRWIFLHNGFIRGYEQLRRELVLAIEPELFTQVEGTTDWEVLFFLALTFGLADEPLPALERMSRYVPAVMPSLCASAVAWPRVLTSSLRRIAET